MSFAMYLVGALIVIGGLIYAAILLNAPTQWVVVGVIVMVGLAILAGVKATRQKDHAE